MVLVNYINNWLVNLVKDGEPIAIDSSCHETTKMWIYKKSTIIGQTKRRKNLSYNDSFSLQKSKIRKLIQKIPKSII